MSVQPDPLIRRKNRDRLGRPVLVVEDQRSLAEMLSALLQDRWGCEVHIADTLNRAKALLAQGHPYLAACCDLNLPDVHHDEVIDAMTEWPSSASRR
ncbi:MAG TPA: hypothetical protein VJ001_17450 [Rhodocyclaceae bacterium]|nr:hypothetical protein [Rhodocyclaceae bacterium]